MRNTIYFTPISDRQTRPEETIGDPNLEKVVVLGETSETSRVTPIAENASILAHEATNGLVFVWRRKVSYQSCPLVCGSEDCGADEWINNAGGSNCKSLSGEIIETNSKSDRLIAWCDSFKTWQKICLNPCSSRRCQ